MRCKHDLFVLCLCSLLAFGAAPYTLSPALAAPTPTPTAAAPGVAPAVVASSATSKLRADEAQRVVRALINAIRYKKDSLALLKLATSQMSERLLKEHWSELTASEQKQFIADLEKMLVHTSFARGREMFAYLDAVVFASSEKKSQELHIKSTIVVHRQLKKAQIPIDWVLVEEGGNLRVVDIISQGDSTANGIYEDEVVPLIREGGTPLVLKTLHTRALEVAQAGPEKP